MPERAHATARRGTRSLLRTLLGVLVGLLAYAWLSTLRLTVVLDPALHERRGPFALTFWHGQQFALLRWARLLPMVALVSRSRDGELVASALSVLGVQSARGSSSRGGAAALLRIVRKLRAGIDAAFAVDGPRGPARVVRSEGGEIGAAHAARLGGAALVPMAAACSRCHVFSRAWDRFELPLPWSHVAVVLGAPLAPADATSTAIAAAIDRARARAEELVRSRVGARTTADGDPPGAPAARAR